MLSPTAMLLLAAGIAAALAQTTPRMTTTDGNLQFNLASGSRLAVRVGDGQVSFLDNVQEATMDATIAALRLGMELGRDLAAAQHGSELQTAIGQVRSEVAATNAAAASSAATEAAALRATVQSGLERMQDAAAANASTVAASVARLVRDIRANNASLRTAIAEQRGYSTSEVVLFGDQASRRTVNITHAVDNAHRRLVSVWGPSVGGSASSNVQDLSFHCTFDRIDGNGRPYEEVSGKTAALANGGSRSRVLLNDNAPFGPGAYYFYDRDYHMYWRPSNGAGGALDRNQLCLTNTDFTLGFWFKTIQGYRGGGFHGSLFGVWNEGSRSAHSYPSAFGLGLLSLGGIRWYRRGSIGHNWNGPKFQAGQWYHIRVMRIGDQHCFFINGVRKTCWSDSRSSELGACNRDSYDVKMGGLWDWDHQPQIIMDEFKVFKRAVAENMNNFDIPRPPRSNAPVALSEPRGFYMYNQRGSGSKMLVTSNYDIIHTSANTTTVKFAGQTDQNFNATVVVQLP